MIKFLQLVLFSTIALPIASFGRTCDEVNGEQAYQAVDVLETTVCFVYTTNSTERDEPWLRESYGVAMHSLFKSEKPRLVYEFPYAGTNGKINDAFVLSVGDARKKMLFVIHSIEAPRMWDALSDIYDVSAFSFEDGTLVRDELYSEFFDMGGDMNDDKGRLSYIYPYKDRRAVARVVQSALFKVARASSPINAVLQEKAYLYSGSVPITQKPSRMYLIKGDRVTVESSSAGWCKVSYAAKLKPLVMWVQCKSVNVAE